MYCVDLVVLVVCFGSDCLLMKKIKDYCSLQIPATFSEMTMKLPWIINPESAEMMLHLGGGFIFFPPYLGKSSNLTDIFQMGGNHPSVLHDVKNTMFYNDLLG